MERTWFGLGAILALLGVVSGAFAAHALEDRISPENLDTWQTAARYHFLHALGLLAAAYAAQRWGGAWTTAAGWLFVTGILLFSGSLYLLATTSIKALGAITPLGGLCFMLGWAFLAVAVIRG